MQDPTTFQAVKPHFPELEHLKCPRCDSTNTKFCYYNNYNLSQPRHFCKNCRRYWTKGGALRNIPVGGGTRKNTTKKRQKPDHDPSRVNPNRKSQEPSSLSHPQSLLAATSQETGGGSGSGGSDGDPGRIYGLPMDQDHKMLDISGSFSSLLASNDGLGSVLDGLNPNGLDLKIVQMGGYGARFHSGESLGRTSGLDLQGTHGDVGGGESYMQSGGGGGGDSSCWIGGGNGWPDLAIYTPGSNFQ